MMVLSQVIDRLRDTVLYERFDGRVQDQGPSQIATALDTIRAHALRGDIIVHGRQKGCVLHDEIPQDYWRDFGIDYYEYVGGFWTRSDLLEKGRAGITRRIVGTMQPHEIWYHGHRDTDRPFEFLLFPDSAVNRLWPPTPLTERLRRRWVKSRLRAKLRSFIAPWMRLGASIKRR